MGEGGETPQEVLGEGADAISPLPCGAGDTLRFASGGLRTGRGGGLVALIRRVHAAESAQLPLEAVEDQERAGPLQRFQQFIDLLARTKRGDGGGAPPPRRPRPPPPTPPA